MIALMVLTYCDRKFFHWMQSSDVYIVRHFENANV